jgi:CNT family concentrative nucleoside transporter
MEQEKPPVPEFEAGIQPVSQEPSTPWSWRLALAVGITLAGVSAFAWREQLGPRGRAGVGVICFLGVAALFSANLRRVNWRTIGWGIGLQVLLALFILKLEIWGLESQGIPDGFRPGYELFHSVAQVVSKFLEFADEGARFVFYPLSDAREMDRVFGPGKGFVFAFRALPTIIFVSSFFTVLYYFGVLQFIVRILARCMMYLMRTSGAESLSAAANVFMGQTEAPLIVKPYVARMTQSELLALMVGGMATISGGLMAVYIQMGANPVAILATSVMAAPCGMYLSKLLLPELGEPETSGRARIQSEKLHRNVVDAAAAGASDGLSLALNVAAMLIAFLAILALIDFLLGQIQTGQSLRATLEEAPVWLRIVNVAVTLAAFFILCYAAHGCISLLPGSAQQPIKETLATLPFVGRVLGWALGYVAFLILLDALLPHLPKSGLSLKLLFSWIFAPVAF